MTNKGSVSSGIWGRNNGNRQIIRHRPSISGGPSHTTIQRISLFRRRY